MLIAHSDPAEAAAIADLIGPLGAEVRVVASGAEVLAQAAGESPALVVLELALDGPSAYVVCQELREDYGQSLPIVFVTASTNAHDEIAALLLGGDDYFVTPLREERFSARIRRLLARAPARAGGRSLTKREHEVLELLADGQRTAEIAEILYITPKTVATHVEHILAKLGAHSQAQAVAFAMRDRILVAGAGAPTR